MERKSISKENNDKILSSIITKFENSNDNDIDLGLSDIEEKLKHHHIKDFIIFLSYNEKSTKTKIISENTFFNTVFDNTLFNNTLKTISGFETLNVNCNEDIKKLIPLYFPFKLRDNPDEYYFMIGFCNEFFIEDDGSTGNNKYYNYNKNLYLNK